jgi:hypothetical protein
LPPDSRCTCETFLHSRKYWNEDTVILLADVWYSKEVAEMLDGMGFTEGSNSQPGEYVIERAFVG